MLVLHFRFVVAGFDHGGELAGRGCEEAHASTEEHPGPVQHDHQLLRDGNRERRQFILRSSSTCTQERVGIGGQFRIRKKFHEGLGRPGLDLARRRY